jgi:glycerophosphoryl diester phosphodiesterase
MIIGLFIFSLSYLFQPPSPFYSIAHRGASAYAPENTMAAFNQAVKLGFDYVELDVRISKDGELIVIHDSNVKRTTDGEGFVSDLTVQQLKKLDAGSWFDEDFSGQTIPLLSEVLAHFGGKIGLIIDIKSPQKNKLMMKKLSELLNVFFEKGVNPQSIKVQSFQISEVKRFHRLCPEVSVGLLLNKPVDMFHLSSYRSFASFISVDQHLLSKSFINKAKSFNFEVYSWTIKSQSQFPVMEKLKVNGIISDEEKKDDKNDTFIAFFKEQR